MIETMKFTRKPFHIDGVQVTETNLKDVAIWCSGEVVSKAGQTYIKVKVQRPLNERQTKAYVGDWVLFAGKGFKVYTPKAFEASFEQIGVATTMHMGPAVIETTEEVVVQEKPKTKTRKPVVVAETTEVVVESTTEVPFVAPTA